MPANTTCPSCSKTIFASPEGRMPPWCSHCGASLKASPNAGRPPEPARPVPRPEPVGALGVLPNVDVAPTESFFHACIPAYSENYHQLYRIYVTATDLLIFAIGIGPVVMGEVLPRTRSAIHGPKVGLAAAVAEWEDVKQRQLAVRIQELDAANESMLRAFAEAGDRGFTLEPVDCVAMSLSGPSLWYRWVCGLGHEAVWKFRHLSQGNWKLALPSLRDARRAAEHLPRLFGNQVEVNLNWGRKQ